MLRAVQFAARFDLTLDDDSRALCGTIPLDDLPAERVWGEFEKLLLATDAVDRLRARARSRCRRELFPELHALVGCVQEPEWHPEGDVWVHTLQVIDQARTRIDDLPRPQQMAIMLGAVCHDLGKPATTAFIDGRIDRSITKSRAWRPRRAFLDRLNVHSIDGYDVRRQVLGMTAQHLKPGMWFKVRDEVGDGAFRRLAQKVDLELLARLAKSDCLGREPGVFNCAAMDWFLDRARALGVGHRPPAPILLGRHLLALGLKPGPRVGEILKAVYEQQLDGTVTTLEEAIAAAAASNRAGLKACTFRLRALSAAHLACPACPVQCTQWLATHLVYGVRLIPEGSLKGVEEATMKLADGSTAGAHAAHLRRHHPAAAALARSQPRRVLRSAARRRRRGPRKFAE